MRKIQSSMGSQDESENFLRTVKRMITVPLILPRGQPLSNSMVCNNRIHWKSLDILGEGTTLSTFGYRSKTRNFLVLISKSDTTDHNCLKWSMLGVSFRMAFHILDMH